MSVSTMVIGESGTGKSTAMRNLDPAHTLLIQAVKKPLPFKATGWNRLDREKRTVGNIYTSDDSQQIIAAMRRTSKHIIVLDDFQYVLANEFMRRSEEKGYDKFTEIARHAWDVLTAAANLPDHVRVYILMHSQSDDFGRTKAKTIGKMLDEKITLEGLFSIVLRTVVRDGHYLFATRNNGSDTTKTPLGLFDNDLIDNDLAQIDAAVCAYYELETSAAANAA
ncbi:AAA family ATPase [Chitiniphilus shinanonensis]|uniref:AAA family ATPase n=1 Tax=Chitiniphilus shinanonensis TaxID=553088 RepID=UPI003053C0A8